MHELQVCHQMASQRKISSLQAFEIETSDDADINGPKDIIIASQRVGGSTNLRYLSLQVSKQQRQNKGENEG
jgi:hypothetical protein